MLQGYRATGYTIGGVVALCSPNASRRVVGLGASAGARRSQGLGAEVKAIPADRSQAGAGESLRRSETKHVCVCVIACRRRG